MTTRPRFTVTPSWLVIGGLTALAGGAIYFGSPLGLKGDVTGALAGALLSGAGVVLGSTLERAEARKAADAGRASLRANLETLITAELVGVATSYLSTYRFVATSQHVMENGGAALAIIDLTA